MGCEIKLVQNQWLQAYQLYMCLLKVVFRICLLFIVSMSVLIVHWPVVSVTGSD